MKKTLCLLAVALLAAVQIHAGRTVRVEYSEMTELVSVVAYMAGTPGYVWDGKLVEEYRAEVDSAFGGMKSHEAVRFVADSLAPRGFGWDFPMDIALRFEADGGVIRMRHDITTDRFADRISASHAEKLVCLLDDFYRESRFHDFFLSHLPLYRECEAAMRKVVDRIDMTWYDSFFGTNPEAQFCVYPGLLIGPANYAVRQSMDDGGEVVNAIMGCCSRNAAGEVFYGLEYTLPVLIHEFNHSFCNPLNKACWDSLKEKSEEIYNRAPQFYASIAYGAPELVMNETFVEACVIRYLQTHDTGIGNDLIEKLVSIDEEEKKFLLIRPLIKILAEREARPDLYPTMLQFIPKIVDNVREYRLGTKE